jgi:hypothetical protein
MLLLGVAECEFGRLDSLVPIPQVRACHHLGLGIVGGLLCSGLLLLPLVRGRGGHGGLCLLGRRLGSRKPKLVCLVLCRRLFLGSRLNSGIGGLNVGF